MWTCVWSASGRYGRHGSKCGKPKNWTLEGHFLPFGSFCMGIQAHTTRRGRMVLGLPCVIPQPAIRVTTRIRTILAIELPKNFGILHSLASCVSRGFSSQHGTWRFQDSHGDFKPALRMRPSSFWRQKNCPKSLGAQRSRRYEPLGTSAGGRGLTRDVNHWFELTFLFGSFPERVGEKEKIEWDFMALKQRFLQMLKTAAEYLSRTTGEKRKTSSNDIF